jgi:hypothetical protein
MIDNPEAIMPKDLPDPKVQSVYDHITASGLNFTQLLALIQSLLALFGGLAPTPTSTPTGK